MIQLGDIHADPGWRYDPTVSDVILSIGKMNGFFTHHFATL